MTKKNPLTIFLENIGIKIYRKKFKKIFLSSLLVIYLSEFSQQSFASKNNLSESMILINGGSYLMGNRSPDTQVDEKPIHKVTISSFYLGKYEVSQKEYKEIMGKNPAKFHGLNLPVENISWWDAIKFCNSKSKNESLPPAYDELSGELLDESGKTTADITKVKGYRLPTEAEWEFAAKGGKGEKESYYKHSGTNNLKGYANFCDQKCFYEWRNQIIDDGFRHTSPVDSFLPNELGIYNMSGNVWEWLSDWYDKEYYQKSPEVNPYNNVVSASKVSRGGSWIDFGSRLNVENRGGNLPNRKNGYVGFRIARSI